MELKNFIDKLKSAKGAEGVVLELEKVRKELEDKPLGQLDDEGLRSLHADLKRRYLNLWTEGKIEDAKAVMLAIVALCALWDEGEGDGGGDDETGLGELVLALKPSFVMQAFVRAYLFKVRRAKKKKEETFADDEQVEIIKEHLIEALLDFLLLGGTLDEETKELKELLKEEMVEELTKRLDERRAEAVSTEALFASLNSSQPAPQRGIQRDNGRSYC